MNARALGSAHVSDGVQDALVLRRSMRKLGLPSVRLLDVGMMRVAGENSGYGSSWNDGDNGLPVLGYGGWVTSGGV